jgi:hypothetical protein
MKLGCAYFGNRILKHVAEDMKMLADLGFNFVNHVFSEFDLQFHKDTIRDIVSITKDAGHEVHLDPWGVGNVFGGEPYSNFAAQNIHEACQILDNGLPVAMACPNNPKFLDFMYEWIEAVVYAGADVAFWDEPHFHSPNFLGGKKGRWGCRCRYCMEKFEEKYGKEMPLEEDDEVRIFKIESIREFLSDLTSISASSGLRNNLCVAPHLDASLVIERWRPYAQIPHLDLLGTDPYWQWNGWPVEKVGDYAEVVKNLCDECNLESQIWIQVCKITKGSEAEIEKAVELSRKKGINNLAAWAFEGCAHESWVKCEDPEKAWEITVKSFRQAALGVSLPTKGQKNAQSKK